MSVSPVTSVPRPPAERTFVIAVTVLIFAAIAQLIAVFIALVPQVNFEKIGRSFAGRPSTAAEASASAASPAGDPAKAQSLLDEANGFRAQKNFQGALEAVTEADRLLPNSPIVLMPMASDYFALGKVPESVAVLQKIVALSVPTDPGELAIRQKAVAALQQMGAPATAPTASAGPAAAPVAPTADAPSMRDEVGIPIGSVMGIIKCDLADAEPGYKTLKVGTKASSTQKIDTQKVVTVVDFYEQDDNGQIQHSDSPQPWEWLSAPYDWKNGEPEIFQVKYRMPLTDRGDLPPQQYYGYVVALYYNGELQDQRAEPVSLLDKFPPPVHKDSAAE